MKDLLEFFGVLLIAAMIGGLIYAAVKRNLVLGVSLVAGLLIVSGVWWWLSSSPAPGTPQTAGSGTLSQALQSPSPGGVWEFFKNYWLWIVLVLAIPFSILFAFKETWAKATQGVLVTVATVLVGAMIVHGIWGEKTPLLPQVQQVCPLYSSTEARSCLIGETPAILTTTESIIKGEFDLCFIGPVTTKQVGSNTFEFKSTGGTVFVQYKLLRSANLIGGKCPNKFD